MDISSVSSKRTFTGLPFNVDLLLLWRFYGQREEGEFAQETKRCTEHKTIAHCTLLPRYCWRCFFMRHKACNLIVALFKLTNLILIKKKHIHTHNMPSNNSDQINRFGEKSWPAPAALLSVAHALLYSFVTYLIPYYLVIMYRLV